MNVPAMAFLVAVIAGCVISIYTYNVRIGAGQFLLGLFSSILNTIVPVRHWGITDFGIIVTTFLFSVSGIFFVIISSLIVRILDNDI